MSLRAFGLALGAAAAFSGVAVLEAPVQAADIAGKTLDFSGRARLTGAGGVVGSTSTLDFANGSGKFGPSAGAAINLSPSSLPYGVYGSTFSISDLSLTKLTASTWGLAGAPVANWLSGLPSGIAFTLESFSLTRTTTNFEAVIAGFFTPSSLPGGGDLTTQGKFTLEGTSFSADVTPIPTPALLPGLVGLGFAALRKRGQDNSEQDA